MSEALLPCGGVQSATPALIAGLPHAPAALKASLLACLRLETGTLDLVLPDRRVLRFGNGAAPAARLIVHNPRFAARVLASGDIGFAEGYMAGEWDSPDLAALLELFSRNLDTVVALLLGSPAMRLAHFLRHALRDNTRTGARRNILSHYDLGNRFYAAWLDATMTYSSALFEREGQDLAAAQRNKYRALAAKLELKPGDRMLEIGCGWGGFAEVAARDYGANVTALTISAAQHAFARERMARAGLAERVDVRLQDYRDVEGAFEKVASIEMFEAVGERHWPAYFAKLAAVLKPGGRAAVQIITIRDELFSAYRARADFIQRYIFPGGMLPSLGRLREETARAGLAWDCMQAFGQSYAETLADWRKRFAAAWGEIRTLGFDERFKRLWTFYLSYCEAGFRTARTDVVQVALVRP